MSIFLPTNEVVFGNDIVDLNDPDASIEHLNSRFIKKICTHHEIQWFFPNEKFDNEDLLTLWKIWAIKESSYKAISRIFYIPFFKYKDYIIYKDFINTKYKDYLLNNIIYYNSDFILALTYFYGRINIDKSIKENMIFISWIKKIIKNDSHFSEEDSHSIKIRKYINDTLYNIFREKTMIYRKYEPEHNVYMAPYLYFKKSFYPISLSHHGRFLLFTLSINQEYFSIITQNYNNYNIIKISPIHYLMYEG